MTTIDRRRKKFDVWLLKQIDLINDSQFLYDMWEYKVQGQLERGEADPEMVTALEALDNVLSIETAHIERVRYDEKYQEVHYGDAEMVKQYRKNTLRAIRAVMKILNKEDRQWSTEVDPGY